MIKQKILLLLTLSLVINLVAQTKKLDPPSNGDPNVKKPNPYFKRNEYIVKPTPKPHMPTPKNPNLAQ